jgi:hypothetical protein
MAFFVPVVAGICLGWTVCCVRPRKKRRQKESIPWQHSLDSDEEEAILMEEGTRRKRGDQKSSSKMRSKGFWRDTLASILTIKTILQRRRNLSSVRR